MKKQLFTLLSFLTLVVGLQAQTNIANYTFAQSMGTYVPLPTPTVVKTATATTGTGSMDSDNFRIAFPSGFTFMYGGVAQSTMNINSNGYIGFGDVIWTNSSTSPLANNPTGGTTTGIISAFASDLNAVYNPTAAVVGEISYELIGSAPDRILVVQFKNFKPYSSSATDGRLLNFQIQLFESTHTSMPNYINMAYGNCVISNSSLTTVRVGLRGNSLSWIDNINALSAINMPVATTCNWGNAITSFSTSAASALLFSSTNSNVAISNGLMYTWMPSLSSASLAPVRNFNAVSNITMSGADIKWVAPTAASQYSVQYRMSNSCTWTNFSGNPVTTNSVSLTGLTFGTVYQVRVKSSDGVNNAIWSHIPNQAGTGEGYSISAGTFSTLGLPTDLQTTSLITPAVSASGCYVNGPLVVQIKNAGTSALDFAINNANIYGAVTGTNPQTFTTVVSTGTLAANATMNVTLTTSYNMSAVGVYSINAGSMLSTPDANTANDMMAQVTRTATSSTPLPYAQDFPTTALPAGWQNPSFIIGASGHGLTSNGIYKNMWSSATTGTFSLLKLGSVVGNESFTFDYRVLNYSATYPGTQVPPTGAWGNFKVQVSSDCGATYIDLATIDNTTHTITTQAWTNKMYSLSAFAGQNILVRVVAALGDPTADYFIDIDNINVASCFAPTALTTSSITNLTADVSWTAPLNGTPAAYVYEIRTAGAANSGTTGLATTGTVTAPSTSVAVTGLTAYTAYSVYVVSNCGGSDFSIWSPASTFTTLCTIPTAPTATNSSQCGLGVSMAQVSGGTGYNWYADATSTVVLQTGTSSTYTTPIGVTTTFYVSVNDGICLSPRSAITTTVSTPESVMASATATALCPGGSSVLLSVTQATATVYNFTWTATPSAGSGMTSLVAGQTVSVLPTTFGTYVYQVIATDGICTTSSSITVIYNDVPSIIAAASPSASCSGADVLLNAMNASPGMITIGTGTTLTSATSYPTAFGNYWYQTWQQYLYTAAELNAMGLTAGNITSLAFNVSTLPNPNTPITDYNVQIAPTTNTALAAFTTSGLTNVFGPATVNAASGVNTINLSTPYNWDGVSNLIIDLRQTEFYGSGNARTYYTATPDNSVLYSYSSTSNTSYWTSNPTPTTSKNRPNITFGGIVAASNPAITWQWNPGAINSSTAMVNPVNTGTASTVMMYTVSATNTVTGCSNTATTSVVVNPLPNAPLAHSSAQCGLGVSSAFVSGGTSYNWYAAPTSSMVLQSGATTNFTATIGATTTWYVSSFDGTCESPRTAVSTTVTIPDVVTAVSTASNVCPGGSYTLEAVKTGTANTYAYTWNATPSLGSGMPVSVSGATQAITPTTAGNYNYVVTAVDGVCTTTASVMVALNDIPVISNVASTPTAVCSNETFMLQGTSYGLGSQSLASYTCVPPSSGGACLTEVSINTLNRLSACETGNYIDVPTTAATTSLIINKTYSLTLSTNASAIASVWFDWNKNGNFEASEWIQPFTTGTVAIVSVTVPASATTGVTKMRVRTRLSGNTNGASDACSSFGSGEAEDYTINILADLASNYTWVWNPGSLNGNMVSTSLSNTTTVAMTQVYSVTVTNSLTGCSNSATTSIVINPLPTAPVVANAIQCGLAVPTASVSGGTSYNWYATPTATTALQMGTATNYTTVIGTTTSWYVASFNGTCESPRVMVTQSVTIPDAIMATTSASAICPNGSFSLMASNSGTTNVYNYSWVANPVTGSGIPTSVTGASVSVSPTAAGSYDYLVTGVDGACTTTAVVNVMVNPSPSIVSSATPSMVCSGETVTLNAINGSLGMVAVGNGTTLTSATSYPTAFGNYWYQTWQQYLFTAAELNAMGLAAGNITSLAFNVSTIPSPNTPITDYNVQIAPTTNTALAVFTTSGLTNVFGPATVNAALGVNTINLSTPYNWDGVSNLIIDLRQTEFYGSGNARTYYTATPDNSVLFSYATSSNANYWTSNPTPTTSKNRPNISFGGVVAQNGPYTFQWNPGAINSNTATVNPINTGTAASTSIYTVSVTNTITGCSSMATNSVIVNPYPVVAATSASSVICANYTTTLTATGATSYTWMPAGGNVANAIVMPSATTVYTVVGTTAGCSGTATVEITTNPSPTITVASSATSAVCPATSVTLATTGVATTYTWNPAVSTSSMAVVTPTANMTYTVMAEDLGCITTKTIAVAVNGTTLNVVASNTAICLGTTSGVTILASGSAVSYTWSPAVTTSSLVVVTPTMTTNYVITGANALGCETTKSITINVANTPTVTITSSSPSVCAGSSATLTANGATNYTWSPITNTTSVAVVTPTGTSMYTVYGEANGCSSTGTVTVVTNALPVVNASATPTLICKGESATLSATTTATSYTWSNGANTISTVVTPSVTSGYMLTVSDGNCTSSTTVSVSVSDCIGIEELSLNGVSLYPNPTTEILNIDINSNLVDVATVNVYDALGKLVISQNLTSEKTIIRTSNLDTGMYFVKIISNNVEVRVQKLIKQ